MPKGGARNRSGPPADPNSGRSDARGYSLTALPAEGYKGEAPPWPLPRRKVFDFIEREKAYDAETTEAVSDREAELWSWAWSTPQACAWSMPSESWRLMTIAHWVRTAVLCESSEATAADKNSLHRFADQIGLTPAGLRENGWKVAVDEVSKKAAESNESPTPTPTRQRRLRVADAQ